ncbi:MAG: purine-nucleoside phosphorylase [Candidatus Latescibacteria bacterium]|nr:purine-nucleoside phosphorylase [Candidatus Latescibacterota bacterium]
MNSIHEAIIAAKNFIFTKTRCVPQVGIVLGTGLGGLAREIETEAVIPYTEIPGFVSSTVEFHEGKLIFGYLAGKSVVAMQGRFHSYEGYSMQEITFPVRVIKSLGASSLIISNAAGGMNPEFKKGDLVLIEDHINLLGDNPLIGVNEPELGPRFVDMCEPYSRRLMEVARTVANEQNIEIKEGVYVALQGPSLETRAEYRFLRMIGADMVGMSTVPENIIAVQMGMEVLGITIISDMCIPDFLEPANINEIIAICMASEPILTTLIREVIVKI